MEKSKLLQIISIIEIAACVLLVTAPTLKGCIISACLFTLMFFIHKYSRIRAVQSPTKPWLLRSFIWAYLTYLNFAGRWEPSSKAKRIAKILNIDVKVLVFLVWGVLFAFAVFELNSIVENMKDNYSQIASDNTFPNKNVKLNGELLVVIFISAFVGITFLSKSSFLYPLNDWVDANVFFTMGKSILKGKVIYKDIFDHKGPLIYILHAGAAAISNKTFLGVYLMEVIAAILFLSYSTKIILCFVDSKYVKFTIPFICAVTYSSTAFSHGDSVEEFFLPLLTYSLYIGIRICIDDKIELPKIYLVGLCSGVILWTKYTGLGFYIGWIIVFAIYYLKKGKIQNVLKAGLSYLGGIVTVTIPVFFYFLANDALKDLYQVYFYDNITLYANIDNGTKTGLFLNIAKGILDAFQNNALIGLIIVIFGISLNVYKNKLVYVLILTTIMTCCMFTFCGSTSYVYYSLTFCTYLGLGMIYPLVWLSNFIDEKHSFPKRILWPTVAFSLLCFLFALCCSPNRYLLFKDKNDMPQYKFAKIMAETEDATLLNYGFLDGGFYTVSGIVPDCKFFCKVNMPLRDMSEAQELYLQEKKTKYVVTRDRKLVNYNYVLLAETEFCYESTLYKYRLYRQT